MNSLSKNIDECPNIVKTTLLETWEKTKSIKKKSNNNYIQGIDK